MHQKYREVLTDEMRNKLKGEAQSQTFDNLHQISKYSSFTSEELRNTPDIMNNIDIMIQLLLSDPEMQKKIDEAVDEDFADPDFLQTLTNNDTDANSQSTTLSEEDVQITKNSSE